jgi:hypothetical protein
MEKRQEVKGDDQRERHEENSFEPHANYTQHRPHKIVREGREIILPFASGEIAKREVMRKALTYARKREEEWRGTLAKQVG